MVQRARPHLRLCPGERYLGGELDLFCLDEARAVLVQGRVDALWASSDGGVEVRDYKTGAVASRTGATPDHRGAPDPPTDDVTVASYAVLAAAAYPDRRPVRVTVEDLAEGLTRTREFDDADLRRAWSLLHAVTAEIEGAEDFPARPSPLCATCGFRDDCPDAADV